MNITQLQCFSTLAKTLNYMRTAEQLHISQPAVSKQIISLENELGTKLFVRSTHSVSLTPVGERFLQDASTILKIYYSSVEWISSQQKKESFCIGYSDSHIANMLSKILDALLLENKNLVPSFSQDETDSNLRKLLSNQIDVVIGIKDATFEDDSIIFTKLYTEKFVCVIRKDHPLAQLHLDEITTNILNPYRQIIYMPQYLLKNYFVRGRTLLPVNDTLQNALVSSSNEAYVLLQAGYGFCLLPSYQAITQKNLMILKWKESPKTAFGIYYRKNECKDSLSRKFIDSAKNLLDNE